jgi:hypothetical protein
MISTAQRRFAPMVIGIDWNPDRHQIGISDRHRWNPQPASTTCSSWSDGRVEPWPPRSLNSPLSIQTNRPLKLSVTGITGWRRATVSELGWAPAVYRFRRHLFPGEIARRFLTQPYRKDTQLCNSTREPPTSLVIHAHSGNRKPASAAYR